MTFFSIGPIDYCMFLFSTKWFIKNITGGLIRIYNTVSIACVFTHPLEYILGNVFPGMSAVILFKSRMHIVCVLGSFLFLFIATHEGHSGLEFPVSAFEAHPFHITAEYHDFHHFKNTGNFAAYFSIWDSLFGTNKAYLESQNNNASNLRSKIK